jgi:hypothetical protein
MNVAEPLEPNDPTEAELAPRAQGIPRRRRLLVVEEVDDEPVVVVVRPGSVGKGDAAGHGVPAPAHGGAQPPVNRAGEIKSLIHAVWDDELAATIVAGFAWSKHLPEDDRRLFVDEVRTELRNSMATGNLEPYFQLIDAWRSTAEVWADPETLAILTTDPDPTGDPDADPSL